MELSTSGRFVDHSVPSSNTTAESPTVELPYSVTLTRAALRLLETDSVVLSTLDEGGVARGAVLVGGQELPCSIQLFDDGRFLTLRATGEPAPRSAHGLAVALRLARIWRSKKQRKAAARLFSTRPSWLHDGFEIVVPLDEGAAFELAPTLRVEGLRELQAYWSLLDIAESHAKLPLPGELLARHVLCLPGADGWAVRRGALEAILRRLDAVKAEELGLAEKPAGGDPLGFYSVRRKGEDPRPYRVLLANGDGIDGSCSCPDFVRAELGLCKHLLAVACHWYGDETRRHRLAAAGELRGPRLRWRSPRFDAGRPAEHDPLEGIWLVGSPKPLGLAAAATHFTVSDEQQVRRFAPPPRGAALARLAALEQLTLDLSRAGASLSVDPAISTLLAREVDRLAWPAQFPSRQDALLAALERLPAKLYPYQVQGVMRALERGRFLIGDDMGLGKTTQAVAWSEALLGAGEARRVLVVCPAALKDQWRSEWRRASGREILVVDGSAEERRQLYNGEEPVLVVNYEQVLRDVGVLALVDFDAVILDEAQRIKNYATQTSRKVKQLQSRFRLVLTGTPMENRPQELVSLMDWVDADALGPYWRVDVVTQGASASGRGLAELRARVMPHLIRRRRAEVLKDLPSRTDTVVPVQVTDEQLAVHDELRARMAGLLRIQERRPLAQEEHLRLMTLLTQMRVVSSGMALFEFEARWPSLAGDRRPGERLSSLASPKLEAFRGLIEGLLEQDGVKVVIFSQWRRMLRLAGWSVDDLLKGAGAEAVFFTGAESARKRTENIVRFHDDPTVRLFFATDAGGVGLNLQRAATVCVNLELPWNPAVLEQRIGRIYRLGQEQPVQIFKLLTQGTIEERIAGLVERKRAVFEALFDGGSDEIEITKAGGFYERLREAMSPLPSVGESAPSELSGGELTSLDDAIDASIEERAEAALAQVGEDESLTQQGGEASAAIAELFSRVRLEQTPSGGIRLEADGDAAQAIGALFAGMAKLLGAARTSSVTPYSAS